MNLDFAEILKKAWKTIWKFKILWIFGILAGCSAIRSGVSSSGGGGNNFNFNNNSANGFNNLGNNPGTPPALRQFFWDMQRSAYTGQIWQTLLIAGIVILLAVIIFSLIFLIVASIGQIGLVNGAWQLEEGAEKLNFGTLLKEGWASLLKVVLYRLLWGVFDFLLGIVFLLLTVITLGCGLLVVLPASLVIPFALWILAEFVLVAMVGDHQGLVEAIQNSLELIKKNWLSSGVMGLILAAINLVYTAVLAVPIIFLVIPAVISIIIGVASKNGVALGVSLGFAGLLILVCILVAAFFNGVKEAYLGVVWTMVYRRLTGRSQEVESKAARMESLESDLPPSAG